MAEQMNRDVVIEQLLAVLQEGVEGPAGVGSWFTDNDPNAGLAGTLARISAEDASRSYGGASVAAHVHHTIFGMRASAAWIAGDRGPRDWNESWSVDVMDEAAWERAKQDMQEAYADLRDAIQAHAPSSPGSLAGAVGAVAHVAYHLGAIRNKIALARSKL